jgi:lipoprotein-anchoring transpeptidase ErfK/SrfK
MIDTAATRWRRLARAIVSLALPALAIAVVTAGCGGSSGAASSDRSARTVTVIVHHGRTTATASATPSTQTGTDAGGAGTNTNHATGPGATAANPHTGPKVRPTTLAIIRRAVAMRSAPGDTGHVLGRVATHTSFGSSTALPIVVRRGQWLGVTSLLAGNGRLGWIPRSAVSLSQTEWRIYVSIDRQRITVSYGDRIVQRIRTSTGVPGASTPTGHFAVTDRLRTGSEVGPYGCCILALSAVQPRHLSDWDGGNRIAIHATIETADLGRPASHGCAHVDDAAGHWLLQHIPNGTPVVIETPPFHRGRGSPA